MAKTNRWSLSNFFRFYEKNQIWSGGSSTLQSSTSFPLYDWRDSRLIDVILKLPQAGTITCYERAYRPDLISLDIYQSMEYWQVLLLYNDIMSIDDLTPNKVIKYPSREKLESALLKSVNPSSITIPVYDYDDNGDLVKTI